MLNYFFTISSGVGTLLSAWTTYVTLKSAYGPHAARLQCIWITSYNLLLFVDSIIWSASDMETWWDGKIYCDINIKIKNMAVLGIPGAGIGLARFLKGIAEHQISENGVPPRRYVLFD